MNSTTHLVTPEEVMAFVDNEWKSTRNDHVVLHIAECQECQKVEAGLRLTSEILRSWKIEALPSQVDERLRETAASNPQERATAGPRLRFPAWGRWVLGLGLAAVVILILGQTGARREAMPYASFSTVQSRTSSYIGKLPKSRQQAEPKERAALSSSLAVDENGQLGNEEGIIKHEESASPLPAATPPSLPLPMIARTISLSIEVKDFAAARGTLDAILARHRGYAAGLTVNTAEGAPRTLNSSLRVPAPELAATLGELKALGRVENETQSGEEVTQQHADLVARLKNSRETEQRMQAILLQRTGKIGDVLEVEQEIARVRGEIEQMEAEQKSLEHRVDFATVNLNLADVYKAQLTAPFSVGTRLRNGFVDGYHRATETLLGIALFFIESGPSLLVWLAFLGLPVFIAWRRYRRSVATV